MYEREYLPPADGAPDSADPGFRARVRACGRCREEFTTSARWRYFCQTCRRHADVRSPTRRTFSFTRAKGRMGAE